MSVFYNPFKNISPVSNGNITEILSYYDYSAKHTVAFKKKVVYTF